MQTLADGWQLYGKTASGVDKYIRVQGWFVGSLERGQQQYLFVTNFTDKVSGAHPVATGEVRAKRATLAILHDLGIVK